MRTAFFMPFPGTLYCTLVYLDEVNLNFIHYFCYIRRNAGYKMLSWLNRNYFTKLVKYSRYQIFLPWFHGDITQILFQNANLWKKPCSTFTK